MLLVLMLWLNTVCVLALCVCVFVCVLKLRSTDTASPGTKCSSTLFVCLCASTHQSLFFLFWDFVFVNTFQPFLIACQEYYNYVLLSALVNVMYPKMEDGNFFWCVFCWKQSATSSFLKLVLFINTNSMGLNKLLHVRK